MDKDKLTNDLLTVKEVIVTMREAGMADAVIIKEFGLNNVQLGKSTMKLYQAMQDGKVKETDTLQHIASIMGWNSHNVVLYHLKKLKQSGYIA